MAKCALCRHRKAKRYCIALEKSICSLCCGIQRQEDIHCPASCTYLEQHRPYQDKRTLEKTQRGKSSSTSQKDILSDERLAWLAFNIEMPIAQTAANDPSLTDRDALEALDYSHKKLKEASLILISAEKTMRPKNNLGEAVFQNIEKCRFEKTIVLPGEHQTYTKDEKLQCLERLILSVKQVSAERTEAKSYIRHLLERFSQISALSHQQKLIIPK